MEINTIHEKFGRFSQGQFGQTQGSSSVTTDEAYKLLGLKKGATKRKF